MKRQNRTKKSLQNTRGEIADRLSELERSQLRLQHLYDISKLLTQFQSAEQTLTEVVALIDRSLPVRNAIFILESRAGPRVVTWHAADEDANRLEAAQDHAQTAYRYLVRSRIDVRHDTNPSLLLPKRDEKEPESFAFRNDYVILPLVVNQGAIFGALQIESAERLEEVNLAFLNAVVNQIAVAIDRYTVIAARQETVEARERHQRFLAEATAILSTSLDYRETLAAVVRLTVPGLADVCFLDEVTDDGDVRRLEVAFADQSQRSHADRMKHLPPDERSSRVVKEVLVIGKARLIEGSAVDDLAEDEAIRALGPKSLIVVPLLARGRKLGALKLIAAWSRRQYSVEDLAFAEELADRCGLAMDNARLYEEAHRAVRARDDLLAIVSHDLRNPLNSISLSLGMMKFPDGEERRKSQRQLATIERSAARMNRLIDDLLDAASIEAGHLSIEKTRFGVEQLVAEAIDALQPLAAARSVELKAELSARIPAMFADAARLQQVFANLVGNAIKFTPAGGVVTVRAKPTGEAVTFSVTDTGSGIGEDVLPRLFDRFSQAKRTARLGTGLGLFIVKGIIEAHRGRVWVESRLGEGSTFFFAVPIASGETEA
jgi:signal transduction histidine kinase